MKTKKRKKTKTKKSFLRPLNHHHSVHLLHLCGKIYFSHTKIPRRIIFGAKKLHFSIFLPLIESNCFTFSAPNSQVHFLAGYCVTTLAQKDSPWNHVWYQDITHLNSFALSASSSLLCPPSLPLRRNQATLICPPPLHSTLPGQVPQPSKSELERLTTQNLGLILVQFSVAPVLHLQPMWFVGQANAR